MKKQFIVPVTVDAYSQEDAQAKVDLLLGLGAFMKDFNVKNLAGSFLNHFIISKVAEITEKKRQDLNQSTEKQSKSAIALGLLPNEHKKHSF
jgi:uncharacterized membrane-anchored protein YitT (DUF2179 family)